MGAGKVGCRGCSGDWFPATLLESGTCLYLAQRGRVSWPGPPACRASETRRFPDCCVSFLRVTASGVMENVKKVKKATNGSVEPPGGWAGTA